MPLDFAANLNFQSPSFTMLNVHCMVVPAGGHWGPQGRPCCWWGAGLWPAGPAAACQRTAAACRPAGCGCACRAPASARRTRGTGRAGSR